MELKDIYKKIFPIGGIDNNNRYREMTAQDINCVQLIEPTISVSELVTPFHEKMKPADIPDRMSFRIPIVSINNTIIDNRCLVNFQLDYSSFVPTIMVEFVDMNNEMLSTNSIKDGSIIKVYIGGQGDELYYKPIRQDFMITDIQKINAGEQNRGDWIQYRLRGTLNVPMGHKKRSWKNKKATTSQELFNLAIYTGLGFATNFTETTIDAMQWENNSGKTFFDFMRSIAEHACYSPNTFFTAFVDQYYVLNFVECHRLLSHGGEKTDTPAMIYAEYQQDMEPKVDKIPQDGKNIFTTDQIDVQDGRDEKNNPTQRVSYYFITNHHFFNGWSNFIESYSEISDGYASMDEGYRKHLTYSDSNAKDWGTTREFVLTPIDNMERVDATQEIKPLPDKVAQDTYVPLNLMHTNNPEYQNGSLTSIDKMSEVESFINLGQVDTSNMFKQYYFAEIQNEYQMRCMKKCGLRLTLANYNPAITKFSRIWVDIYDMNIHSSSDIKPDLDYEIPQENKTLYDKYIEKKNENIIYYEDEGIDERSGENENFPRGNYNRSLSGWYVVTEMRITFDNFKKNLKTHLVLNRIEHRPLYKDAYELAKGAIEKYRFDYKAEDIWKNIDDFSY